MQFPNESKAYRAARDDLLKAEIDLRRRSVAMPAKPAANRDMVKGSGTEVGGSIPSDQTCAPVLVPLDRSAEKK